jgi:hypothetical protein
MYIVFSKYFILFVKGYMYVKYDLDFVLHISASIDFRPKRDASD